MRLKPRYGDYLVLIVVLVSALVMLIVSFQQETPNKIAVIIQEGVEIKRIPLDKDDDLQSIPYTGDYPGIIEAVAGRIRFREAHCPDQVCVQTGWISRNGQIAVCLPAHILIRIEGGDEPSDVDIQLH